MEKECHKDEANSWVAPLPFKVPRLPLPNNRDQALLRLASLRCTLDRKPEMKGQFIAFMEKVFESPDLNNSLFGVLIRFRKEVIAVTGDIQQMFYCFVVREDHRNYLWFLWYRDNDMSQDITEYRMRVHVFGNSPSPAVSIYGLRCAAKEGEHKHGADTRQFVERHFYVDDGLISLPSEAEAISLLKRTRASLAQSNLRLHKFASNSAAVMKAFPAEDLAQGIKDLDLHDGTIPDMQSLGLRWEIESDTFTFAVSVGDKPFTRRGVLSMVNSLFDPLGMVAPVTIQGRALLRELCTDGTKWDSSLPEGRLTEWETWRDSLQDLKNLHIPRTYSSDTLSKAKRIELCVFSDASNKAIGAVAYLRSLDDEGQINVGFVFGKAKLTPRPELTIPRLELCGAVLAVEMAELIQDEMDLELDAVKFYCDSKVVLGYISNESKRFFIYLSSTMWFTGPPFLHKPDLADHTAQESFSLIDPELDVEIRPHVSSMMTHTQESLLTCERFERFSTWRSLVRAIALLIQVGRSHKSDASRSSDKCKGWHWCRKTCSPEELAAAENIIIRSVQSQVYSEEYKALSEERTIPKTSPLWKLNPVFNDGLIRIGGRLTHAELTLQEKSPVVLPRQSHITTLLVRHHHELVKHQGRQFTEGAI
ncbi:hypothetical protein SKAU_G00138030 [Synaphobranchus kaupii]|uniref:Uncharacterized protein n=1 Tax=Synaphobranchus kaupii TaxID=118154 RepID=A0A9Q1FRT5_SYNKA|nr:hypothetical protein SKAU_G00138030 [Synaphobranchus kaupii]